MMILIFLLPLVGLVSTNKLPTCQRVETLDRSLTDAYCAQPLFYSFLPKTEENQLLDNVCFTFFPLPDDPNTFQVYQARVFCDGSSDITSSIAAQVGVGKNRIASPFATVTDHVLGFAGCDTYIVYRCSDFGESFAPFTYGTGSSCRAIGLSCLRKVEEIIRDHGLPELDYYVLPMKIPNRCVTQQLCLQPPNPFFNKVHTVALL